MAKYLMHIMCRDVLSLYHVQLLITSAERPTKLYILKLYILSDVQHKFVLCTTQISDKTQRECSNGS